MRAIIKITNAQALIWQDLYDFEHSPIIRSGICSYTIKIGDVDFGELYLVYDGKTACVEIEFNWYQSGVMYGSRRVQSNSEQLLGEHNFIYDNSEYTVVIKEE
jgi:hypothetical protein